MHSSFGVYISVIFLDTFINAPSHLWGVSIGAVTTPADAGGIWTRFMNYFHFKVTGLKSASGACHPLEQALRTNAVQHIRVLALFSPDQPRLLITLLRGLMMLYLNTVTHPDRSFEGRALPFVNDALRNVVQQHSIQRPWIGLDPVYALRQGGNWALDKLTGDCFLCTRPLDNNVQLTEYVTDTALLKVYRPCLVKETSGMVPANAGTATTHPKTLSPLAAVRRQFSKTYTKLTRNVKAFLNPLNKCFWCFVLQLDCDSDGTGSCTPCVRSVGTAS
ncbi:hypothetical protein PRZ48_013072 [Zasmidium cellare]|uniref:Uncharacterized protein n=1 Tax=Zasmidium cellare TaxID=395010 RepID=A0ABR0E315_ZASCE|nr:hypothetical protein PRZ48_013072 [Zasmidium cellare]